MGAIGLLVITVSHNVSFMGKTWWVLMLLLRLLVLLLAGFTLFSDEQESFICNTIQPGCSNVCFDVFAPVSVFRLWLFHLLLLALPHVLFVTYVMHEVLAHPHAGGSYYSWSRGASPFENSSRELSLHKSPLHDLPREFAVPRFYCSYFLVVILRILLEVVFGAGQFFLFGLSLPKRFLCYEAPCTSGVECYVSRPTEKTLMLSFMLAVASLSILLSLADLASSMKAMVRWRRKTEMFMEELSKGEQSSVFTATTATDDSDVLLTRRVSLSGSSKNVLRDERPAAAAAPLTNDGAATQTGESVNDKKPESKDAAPHFVLHGHLRPPLSPRPDRGPPPRGPTPMGVKVGQYAPAGTNSGQQSDGSESQDKRAWV